MKYSSHNILNSYILYQKSRKVSDHPPHKAEDSARSCIALGRVPGGSATQREVFVCLHIEDHSLSYSAFKYPENGATQLNT